MPQTGDIAVDTRYEGQAELRGLRSRRSSHVGNCFLGQSTERRVAQCIRDITYPVFAVTAAGDEKYANCQSDLVSLVKVTVARSVPLADAGSVRADRR